ncbi:MAG: spore germination protein, partial [Oscillospiraceae bacterium]|nr:spore germination protein [Oscillospiraceae bacterium]
MKKLTGDLQEDRQILDDLLGVGRNYDLIHRDIIIGGRRGRLYVVDGYGDDGVIERILSFLLGEGASLAAKAESMQELTDTCVTFGEVECQSDVGKILTGVFLGKTALMLEGFDECLLMDAKQYPSRSVEEPANGKVLRGSHDGFTETLVQNTALLRRRIRDTRLTLEGHQLSNRSQTNVVIAYLAGEADEKLLTELREKLNGLDISSVSMSQESVAEAMAKPQWYNPFPKVRYTERPDAATASIMEGDIV